MLEFEETNIPMKAEVTAPTGFVVVPVEQYNELLLAAEAPLVPIRVRKAIWNGGATIEAEVDVDWLLGVSRALLEQRYSTEELAEYDLVTADEVYAPSICIAKRKPAEPEEPTTAEPDPF